MGVDWNPTLECGVECIDNQHKELLKRLNGFIDAMATGRSKGAEEVTSLFRFLDTYVEEHFNHEQSYMQEFKYPDTKAHLAQHEFFIEELTSLEERLISSGPSSSLAIEAKRRLLDWFVNHISEVDRLLAAFLKERL